MAGADATADAEKLNGNKMNRQILGRTMAVSVAVSCLILLSVSPSYGQATSQRQFIVDLYRTYYQRPPTQNNLNEWMGWFQRGSSAEEIHASFIGSEEFFNANNRNLERWIRNVFDKVAGHAPTAQELYYWEQLASGRLRDRRQWALEFLKDYGHRRPPQSGNADTAENLAGQLTADARGLRTSISRDFGGGEGAVLRMQANTLVTAVTSFERAVGNSGRNSNDLSLAYQDVRAAIVGLEASLNRRSNAFNSRQTLNRVSQDLDRLGRSLGLAAIGTRPPIAGNPSFPYPPTGNDRPGGRNELTTTEANQLMALHNQLSRELDGVYFLVRQSAQQSFNYRALAAEIQRFGSEEYQLRSQIYAGANRRQLRRSIADLQQIGSSVNSQMDQLPVMIRIRQGWQQVLRDLDGMVQVVGGRWENPGNRPGTALPDPGSTLRRIDQATVQCDALIGTYAPFLLYSRLVQRLVGELRGLKRELTTLRTAISNGTDGRDLGLIANDVQRAHQDVESAWQAAVREVGDFNPSMKSSLDRNIQTIGRLIR